MKSFLWYLVAGSAFIVSNALSDKPTKIIPPGISSFTCNINGNTFTATSNDSLLTTLFTYADKEHNAPAALFIHAELQESKDKSYFYIQPINDDAPAAPLTFNGNLYKQFYITYKGADNSFYNSTNAPGNFEITGIDTTHRMLNVKLNCILYSSAKKDWLLVTNGRLRLKY